MAGVASEAAAAPLLGDRRAPQDAASTAWFWALPCGAIAAAAILVLGPPLGHLLVPERSPYRFIGSILTGLHPEPIEQGRYLVAICMPMLASLALARAPPRFTELADRIAVPVVVGTQLALAGVVAGSIVAQYRFRFGVIYTRGLSPAFGMHYFSPATLVAGLVLASAVATGARSERIRRHAVALLRESRTRRIVAAGLAAVATAVWMLHAVHSDTEIGNAVWDVRYHLGFTLDETFAVVNGRTPLVNFTAQYGSLWPFVIALPVIVFGKTLLAFSIAACTISALALLAVYGVLRRTVRSATAALLLYLPFLSTSLFMVGGTLRNRSSGGSYYASFPLRYALPLFVAWLAARRIEQPASARRDWLLFTLAGLAVLNNGDFGFAAFAASIAAILWSDRPTGRSALRLAGCALAGLVTAYALVAFVTIARAGALPHLERLVDYARLYVRGGFGQKPIPGVLGIHLLIYLTYVAALLAATVRALRGEENRVLTGMLAWAGMFGLGAGTYWIGRSHPEALVYEFSAWAFALALLTSVAISALAGRDSGRMAVGALVVLFGFGVMACSLAQTPLPWQQVARLTAPFTPTELEPDPNPLAASPRPSVRRFVSSLADGRSRFVVRRGAPVAILLTNGHRVADAYGLLDVTPYTGAESIRTSERLKETVDALRRAGGNTIILPIPYDAAIAPALARMGFEIVTDRGLRRYRRSHRTPVVSLWPGGMAVFKWVDVHNLHPRALR
jgi:hypothetical protein